MRVGSLVYATEQGLGILAKSFFDHCVVTDPVIVRHGRRPTREEWYPVGTPILNSLRVDKVLLDWLKRIDVFLAFETPFIWDLFELCRSNSVKTVLCPMHECLEVAKVQQHPPDMWLCPSHLDIQVAVRLAKNISDVEYLPIPVEVPWRQRTRAEVFVHNAGHGGLRGRNGTAELLQAMRLVKSDAKLILRSQDHQSWPPYPELLGKVTLHEGTQPYDQLWNDGDVFVYPEKFNGLSLPLQEARAAGMLVMCSDRFPMNTWLPTEVEYQDGDESFVPLTRNPLIPVKSYNKGQRTFPQFHEFDEAVIDPRDIAAKIDEFYGADITEYSLGGREWAKQMSWENLKPRYLEVMSNLCG